MIETKQLIALVAISQTQSISAAAKQLGWSQPTISHHLASLARTVQQPIIQSSRSGTLLTNAGTVLVPVAREILALEQRVLVEIASLNNSVIQLSIGVLPTMGATVMPLIFKRLNDLNVSLNVSEAESLSLLESIKLMRIDTAVIVGGPEVVDLIPSGATYRPLLREQMSVLLPATHPLAKSDRVQLVELANEQWIMSNYPNDPLDNALSRESELLGFTPRCSIRSDDYSVIYGYVAAGLGIALIPASAINLGRTDVAVRELAGKGISRELAVVIGAHAPRVPIQLLLTELATLNSTPK